MYCDYYDFREKPFTITPNPRFIFLSKMHQEAFAHLLYGINEHAGFIALTGEVGTGKTTILRALLGQLDEARYRVALILNPCLTAPQLLRSINLEYGLPGENLSAAELLQELNGFLLRENAAGRTVVLVIDEAQNLDPSVLEQIRLISNLETDDDKLIQVVLAGQPELGRILEKPELRQLAQRIVVRYHLCPMDFEDVSAYVNHRLRMAGSGRALCFAPSALKKIYRFSAGVPRLINIICDRTLLIGYAEDRRMISGRLVASAIREIRKESKASLPFRLRTAVVYSVVLIMVAVFAAGALQRFDLQRFSFGSFSGKAATGSDLGADDKSDVLKLTGRESMRQSFNAMAKIWNAPPASAVQGMPSPENLRKLAQKSNLQLLPIKGSINVISRYDTPALIECRVPGYDGKRYLAIVGAEKGRLFVAPALHGRMSFTLAELQSYSVGRAFISWKNFRRISLSPRLKTSGKDIVFLQGMLARAGYYHGKPKGVLDRATVSAIKDFQRAKGLMPDGVAGAETLLFLYRDGSDFSVPRLTLTKDGYKG